MHLIIKNSDNTKDYYKITDLHSKNTDHDEKISFWTDFGLEQFWVAYYWANGMDDYFKNDDEFLEKKIEEFISKPWDEIIKNQIEDNSSYIIVNHLSDISKESKFYDEKIIAVNNDINDYHIEGELGYDEVIYANSFLEVLENEAKNYSEYTEEYQKTLGYMEGIRKAEELYNLYHKIHDNNMEQSISINSQEYINKLEASLINIQKENEKLQKVLVKNGLNLKVEFSR